MKENLAKKGITTSISTASILSIGLFILVGILWTELVYVLTGITTDVFVVNMIYLGIGIALFSLGIYLIYQKRYFSGFLASNLGVLMMVFVINYYVQDLIIV